MSEVTENKEIDTTIKDSASKTKSVTKRKTGSSAEKTKTTKSTAKNKTTNITSKTNSTSGTKKKSTTASKTGTENKNKVESKAIKPKSTSTKSKVKVVDNKEEIATEADLNSEVEKLKQSKVKKTSNKASKSAKINETEKKEENKNSEKNKSEEKNIEEVNEQPETNSEDESKFDTISLKEIREALENKVNKNQKKNIIKEVFINIGIAVLMVIYLLIIIMGSRNIGIEVLEKDMKIITLCILAVGIYILEISYKKDNSKIAMDGIEVLVFGAANLCLIYIVKLYFDNLTKVVMYIVAVIIGYYVIKSIMLSITNIKKYKEDNNDIKEIVQNKKVEIDE